MITDKKSLLETGYFTGLIKAYLENNPLLNPFYKKPFSVENFKATIDERKAKECNRQLLFETLNEQHSSYYSQFPNLESTVNALKGSNTFTVTTGHQLCLATGPLYFIYKIASAIHLCRKLKLHYPDYNFIPVYWMATEDHDFEEINHIHIFNKKIAWEANSQGATGRLSTQGIDSFFEEIKTLLGSKIEEVNFFNVIHNAYMHHHNLAAATRQMVLSLFEGENLLVIDADDTSLKNSFIEIIKKDIFEGVSHEKVSDSINALIASQLIKEEKIQVKPRAINFFYLKNDLRKRIVKEDQLYKVLDTDISFSEAELSKEIESFPERFSPNVIMRPLYQEYILPNLCYLGGAGELSYWFELKAAFDAHGVFFPMLALRNSFLWIDKKQSEKIKSTGLEPSQLFDDIESLINKLLVWLGAADINFENEKNNARQVFQQLKDKITEIDITLGATVDAELQKFIKSLEQLESKALKAQKNKHEISINQLKKIKESLFPGNGLQERYENILWLNLKFGNDIIKQLIPLADPEISAITIITT